MWQNKTSKDNELSNPSEPKKISDTLVIAFLIAYLSITFLPKGMSIDIMGIQWLYISVLNVIVASIIYFYKKKELEWTKVFANKIIILYTTFVVLCGISIFFGENQIEGIVSYFKLLTIFCGFLLLNVVSNSKKSILLHFSIALTFIFFFEILVIFIKYQISIAEFGLSKSYRLIKGNSGNVNIMASTILLKLPFVIYCFFYFKSKKFYFFLVTILLSLYVLIQTKSRTNSLSFSLLLFFTVLFIAYTKQLKIYKSKIIILLFSVFMLYGYCNFQLIKPKEIKKNEISENLEGLNLVNKVSGNRINIWTNTTQLIKQKPLTGVGLGNYKIEVIPHESKSREAWRISKYSHNDFLQIAAESGIFTSLIYVLIFVLISYSCIKKILDKQLKPEQKWLPFIIQMLLLIFVIDSSLNFPFHIPLTQVHFLIILFFFSNLENTNNVNKKSINSNYVLVFVALLSSFLIIPNYKYLKSLIGQNTVFADEKGMKLSYSKVDQVVPNYPNLNEFGYSISNLKAAYLVKENRNEEAINLLINSKNDNKYIMRNENLLASIYEKSLQNDSVIKYRKMSFEMYPKVELFFKKYILALKKSNKIKELEEAKIYLDNYGSNKKLDSIYQSVYNLKE